MCVKILPLPTFEINNSQSQQPKIHCMHHLDVANGIFVCVYLIYYFSFEQTLVIDNRNYI